MKNKEWNRNYMREYNKRPEQKERNRLFMREYSKRPEVRERNRQKPQANPDRKRQRDAAYYRAHRDVFLERSRQQRLKKQEGKPKRQKMTPEQRKVHQREWHRVWRAQHYQKHRERYIGYAKRHAQRYPDKVRMRNSRYRARRKGALGEHTHEQWMARVEFFHWGCVYCKCALNKTTLTKDHAIPLTRGGTDWPSNLVPACRSCNSRKSARTPLEWKR